MKIIQCFHLKLKFKDVQPGIFFSQRAPVTNMGGRHVLNLFKIYTDKPYFYFFVVNIFNLSRDGKK